MLTDFTFFHYTIVAICTFVGLMIGLFGYAVKKQETLDIDDWMWSAAFSGFAGIVWPLTFGIAGFGAVLFGISAVLAWLNRTLINLLKAEKPVRHDRDSETPYR